MVVCIIKHTHQFFTDFIRGSTISCRKAHGRTPPPDSNKYSQATLTWMNDTNEKNFTARQSASLAIVNPSVCLSVRLAVCHTLALSQNDSSYDHGVFTGG